MDLNHPPTSGPELLQALDRNTTVIIRGVPHSPVAAAFRKAFRKSLHFKRISTNKRIIVPMPSGWTTNPNLLTIRFHPLGFSTSLFHIAYIHPDDPFGMKSKPAPSRKGVALVTHS